MTTLKTSELTGAALNWAVAKCEGGTDFMHDGISMHFVLHGVTKVLATGWAPSMSYTPSTNWAQGGPIIDRLFVEFGVSCSCPILYAAKLYVDDKRHIMHGPTHLIAAMRCHVASKMGDTVNVPDELT